MNKAENNSSQKEYGAVANIAEHDTEKERESHTGEQGWVHLLVLWHIKEVDDELESPCEVVGNDVSRRANVRAIVLRV